MTTPDFVGCDEPTPWNTEDFDALLNDLLSSEGMDLLFSTVETCGASNVQLEHTSTNCIGESQDTLYHQKTHNLDNLNAIPTFVTDEIVDTDFSSFLEPNARLDSEDAASAQLQIMLHSDTSQRVETSIDSNETINIFIQKQPYPVHHPRYQSDGKRRAQSARTDPMQIGIITNGDITSNTKTYWLELILTTHDGLYRHCNYLKYHDGESIQQDDSCVRIRIDEADFENGFKRLPNISITRRKRDEFDFFVRNLDGEIVDRFDCNNGKTKAANAKDFVETYDLLKCTLTCRLVVEMNKQYERTNIMCTTNCISEKVKSAKHSHKMSDDRIDSRYPSSKRLRRE